MKFELGEAPIGKVASLARIPIAFRVEQVLDVTRTENGQGGFVLTARSIPTPYLKDYDAIPGEGPSQWARHFDLSHWGFIEARVAGRLVGGAVIAFRTANIIMLEGREDLAVLWDIRVSPDSRGRGIGSALFRAAEAWALANGCRQLKVETQNINLPACRFYEHHGCALKTVNRFAYPGFPEEIQLLWSKDISPAHSSRVKSSPSQRLG